MPRIWHSLKIRIVSVLFGSSILVLCVFSPCFVVADTNDLTAAYLGQINALPLFQNYGLRPVYKNFPIERMGDITYSPAGPDDQLLLHRYMALFAEEIQKYPKSFFDNRGLKNVYFVKKLFYKDRPADGVYYPRYDAILFDFSRSKNNHEKQRHNVHHELYHMISVGHYILNDKTWESLNTEGFRYGNAPKWSAGSNPVNRFAPAHLGFVSNYAMTSIEEDKAEVFACLMIKTQHQLIHRWMKNDEVLKKKVLYMKEFLKYYSADMDEEYWEKLFR